MKKTVLFALLLAVCCFAHGQIKPRPDAFPPKPEGPEPKVLNMASTVSQMSSWDRYPTYGTYLDMMAQWASVYPTLCHIDTIGTSIQGRLILSMYIDVPTADSIYKPEFFYSSTIHGDEITGFVMMLRLIDTLLHGYGSNPQYTNLLNTTRISINPLANPDGTYYSGNNTVQGSRRYNANNVDLNRNYPDPFGTAKPTLQTENVAMINYVSQHDFRLSANLHGGSEVMNYPWDSFTSLQNPHPDAAWWEMVCRRFVDTTRVVDNAFFRDVNNSGCIAGGDWYVISGGRQDYMNYYHNCYELTMEISTSKKLSSNYLPSYWDAMHHSFINYIAEIHSMPFHDTNTYVEASISADSIRFWVGEGANQAIVAVNWVDTALAWGVRFSSQNITVQQAMDSIVAHDWRFAYVVPPLAISYADSTDTVSGGEWMGLLNGQYASGTESVLQDGDFFKWGDLAASVLADRTWVAGTPGGWVTTYVWPASVYPVDIPPVQNPPEPPAVDSAINAEDILYWVGDGASSVVMAINWADTALAWGFRFDGVSVTAHEMMDSIATADPRYSYSVDNRGVHNMFADSAATHGTDTFALWQSLLNGQGADGLSTVLQDGDYFKWGDVSVGVVVDSTWVEAGNGHWEYTFVWPYHVYPVSVPDIPTPPTGVLTLESNTIALYPNPTTGVVHLSDASAYPIEIYNIQGKLMLRCPSGSRAVDLRSLAKGIYLLRSGEASAKIVLGE